MIPSPADLGYFMEVASTLNVSRAAERLGISQPSLSLAIRRMEEALGAPLLVRSKRGVTLTQAGKQVLAHAKNLLQAWEHVRAEALASVNEVQGSYTIGCHSSVALFSIGGFLPDLLEKYPKLDIALKHDISRRIAEDVISLKADIGIVVNPVQHPDLVIHPLCRDEFTLWTSGSGRETEDLKNGKAVLVYDPALAQSQALMQHLARRGIRFGRTVISGNLEVIADLVAQGTGLGFLPVQAAARARNKLKRIPKAPVFYDEHCLIFRVENKNVKSIQVINEAIKSFYARK